MKKALYAYLSFLLLIGLLDCNRERGSSPRKLEVISTSNTQTVHKELLNYLDFKDSSDFINARRGFIATLKDPVIRNADGTIAYNLNEFDFLNSIIFI